VSSAVTNTAVLTVHGPTLINGSYVQPPQATLQVTAGDIGILLLSLFPTRAYLSPKTVPLVVSSCANISGSLVLTLTRPLNASETVVPVLSSTCLSGRFDTVTLVGPPAASGCEQSASASSQVIQGNSVSILVHSSCSSNLSIIIACATIGGVVLLAILAALGLILYRSRVYSRVFGYGDDNRNEVAIMRGDSETRYRLL
jgi:hypothetical protein